MPFTPQQLYTEITADPAALGYAAPYAAGNDVAVCALLNDPTKGGTLLQPIPMVLFAKIAAVSGIRQKLKNGQSNGTYGAICDTAIDMFAELTIDFDPTDSYTQQLMGALVAAGVVTTGDVTAVNAACTLPVSRAAALWGAGTVIQPSDVGAARTTG